MPGSWSLSLPRRTWKDGEGVGGRQTFHQWGEGEPRKEGGIKEKPRQEAIWSLTPKRRQADSTCVDSGG